MERGFGQVLSTFHAPFSSWSGSVQKRCKTDAGNLGHQAGIDVTFSSVLSPRPPNVGRSMATERHASLEPANRLRSGSPRFRRALEAVNICNSKLSSPQEPAQKCVRERGTSAAGKLNKRLNQCLVARQDVKCAQHLPCTFGSRLIAWYWRTLGGCKLSLNCLFAGRNHI